MPPADEGRFYMPGFFRKKSVIIVLALLLASAVPAGATFAWLVYGVAPAGIAAAPAAASRSSAAASRFGPTVAAAGWSTSATVRLAASGDAYAPGYFRFSDDHAGEITVPSDPAYSGVDTAEYLLEAQSALENGMGGDPAGLSGGAAFSEWLSGFLNDNGGILSSLRPAGNGLTGGPLPGDLLFSVKSYENYSTIPVFIRVGANDEAGGLVYGVALVTDDGSGALSFTPFTRIGDYFYCTSPIFPDPEDRGSITLCYAAYVPGNAPLAADGGTVWALGGNKVDMIQGCEKKIAGGGAEWAAPWSETEDASNR